MTSKKKLLQLAARGWEGHNWYRQALTNIDEYCWDRGWDTQKFVAALAVLSPQVSVQQNIKLTIAHFRGEPIIIPRSVDVGLTRLVDADYRLSAIRGPKTSRFARAILGDIDVVTLDTHMGYALGVPATKLRNKGIQAEADKRIGWVANMLGVFPRDAQAMIWTTQREIAGYQYSDINFQNV